MNIYSTYYIYSSLLNRNYFMVSSIPFKKTFDVIDNHLNNLNNSKYFAGLMMLFLNIGSKYITVVLSKNQENFLKSNIFRQILIFTIVWVATRDLKVSILLTAAFLSLTGYLFNENSSMCILPKSLQKLENALDSNNDNIISENELNEAIKIIERAKANTKRNSAIY